MEEPEYVDTREACRLLGVHKDTVSLRVREGLLTPYQSKKGRRYRRSEIEELIRQSRSKPRLLPTPRRPS